MPMDDARRQKKRPAVGLDQAPGAAKHRLEVGLVSGEMENGAADDDVGGVIWKAVRLDGLRPEVRERKLRSEPFGEGPHDACPVWVGIDSVDLVSLAQEEDEVPPWPQPASSKVTPGPIRPRRS